LHVQINANQHRIESYTTCQQITVGVKIMDFQYSHRPKDTEEKDLCELVY